MFVKKSEFRSSQKFPIMPPHQMNSGYSIKSEGVNEKQDALTFVLMVSHLPKEISC